MADDTTFQTAAPATPPAALVVATDQLPDGGHAQLVGLLGGPADTPRATGRISGDATNGLDVDVTRSVLPTGAATESTLGTGFTALLSALAALATNTVLQAVRDRLPTTLIGGRLDVNLGSSAITQPVSGTVTANLGTLNGTALDATVASTNTVLGTTSDPAVSAGAAGTVSNKLRSISRDIVANIVLAAGSARIGKITIRNSADGADIDPLAESTFTGRIGEVQASPTSNTMLDRLKQLLTGIVLAAGENHHGQVGGHIATPAASQFARPADSTVYASGDLVANSTTAGSVAALQFTVARVASGSGMIRRARLKKSTTSVTNAQFRLHLYSASPTVTNGDNGVWLSSQAATYLGAIDITVDKAMSDGAAGHGAPQAGSEISFVLSSGSTIYGLLEARGAYTPGNAETFDSSLEVLQN